ncbi:hypothetical protein CPB83DRAFT_854616 [Crepidotus variabilis]|uniref:(4-O-methyl)-D-glucuronate--lignin esterase n=1 Tax=Crepidotus variabilis TaxID=179855 RepID=A0A9P6JPE7_9AGAR|nr:hypothetical protein CPB83DRAFT_854616 [Crepidotus variabilis]
MIFISIFFALGLTLIAFARPEPPINCPGLPDDFTLQNYTKLTDPFTDVRGKKITTKQQWACRRQEISQLLQQYELGPLPPKPARFFATFQDGVLNITTFEGSKYTSFAVQVVGNEAGTSRQPIPAIISLGGLSIPKPDGIASITFNNDEIANQGGLQSRGVGKFYDLYGSDHPASATIAWAWGVARIIDALEGTTGHNIDPTKLALTGCSRNGKGTIVAGAFNDRIALTIPQESGTGGTGCWRIADQNEVEGVNVQTLREIVTENVWFSPTLDEFVNKTTLLPFDHHLLAALIAPRALLDVASSAFSWLGPESQFGCMKTAHKVWEALGVPDNMGISEIGDHNHCAFPDTQQGDLDAYIQKFLLGQDSDTNILKTDLEDNAGFVEKDWIEWATPTLA